MLGVTFGAAATSFSTKSQTAEKSPGRESSTLVGQAGNTYYYITPLPYVIFQRYSSHSTLGTDLGQELGKQRGLFAPAWPRNLGAITKLGFQFICEKSNRSKDLP